ncbi:MAG: septal ring lytic transglycosylase RlpA family protein [Candidatus Kapaibacteriales bacterium]
MPFRYYKSFLLYFLLVILTSCSTAVRFTSKIIPKTSQEAVTSDSFFEEGLASYYSDAFIGKTTASGEIYSPNEFTAAHKFLPFGTIIRVRNLSNGKEVIVRINDRGPLIKGRVIDLSRSAAETIDLISSGVAKVQIEVIK